MNKEIKNKAAFMKYSIYNSTVNLTPELKLLYNATTNTFIVCNFELIPLMKLLPAALKTQNPSFYSQLLQGGFIVDSTLDEFAEMVKKAKENCNNRGEYRLIINPTTNCNFCCHYCYEKHSPFAKMTADDVERVKRLLSRITDNKTMKHLHLSFFGGEPLLYYRDTVQPIIDHVRSLCEERKSFNFDIHFTTNGFLVNDRLLAHLTAGREEKNFQITLDGPREQHNLVRFSTSGSGSYDRIVRNIKMLLSRGMGVSLRINYTQSNASSVVDILDDIKDIPEKDREHFNIDFQKVWQAKLSDVDNTEIDKAIAAFRKEFKYVSDHYNHVQTFQYPCYGDMVNECVVNYNCDVYKCTARDFTPENRLGYVSNDGEVVWDDPAAVEALLNQRFVKEICKTCRIFPDCGGGCSQTASEATGDVCYRCNSELEKDKIILARFYECVVKPAEKQKEKH